MISFMNSWAGGIIIAVIIISLIEMILPEGKNKKYIKVILGLFLLFTILSPIVTKISKQDFKINDVMENVLQENTKQYASISDEIADVNNQSIREVYLTNLKNDMKEKLKEKGYLAKSIEIELEDGEEYRIKSVNLVVTKYQEESKQEESKNSVNEIVAVNEIKIDTGLKKENITSSSNTIISKDKNSLSSRQITEIKEYFMQVYEVKAIKINE
ncbi:MAG: stage III sporulation protein AF [Clostridia bacterium]